ncbi:MAG: class I tRNA ligase family protein, partial [Tannerella sp.]|nr:class I tRNA ligase family protein [Tannerella sp.]
MLVGDLLFNENGLKEALQLIIFPLWNAHSFFVSYANIDSYYSATLKTPQSENLLDKWILAKLHETCKHITGHMDNYQINRYVEYLLSLIDGLTNWYIRRSRRRFWGSGLSDDKKNAYDTLYYVLVMTCRLMAPVAPLLAEKLYKNLTNELSVHLSQWPQIPDSFNDQVLLNRMALVQNIVNLARSVRNKNQIKNRQPLKTLQIALSDSTYNDVLKDFENVIAEELNVKEVLLAENVSAIADVKYAPNFAVIAEKYPDKRAAIIRSVKQGAFEFFDDHVSLIIDSDKENYDAGIILVDYLAKGSAFVANGNGIVVSLDLTITDELRDEGLAKDIIRNVQDARKQMNYDIMDRIKLFIEGSYPQKWIDYICSETLAEIGCIENPDTSLTIQDDAGQDISIKIKKV